MSGTEVRSNAASAWVNMMPGTRRASDLARDSRVAIHTRGLTLPGEPGRVAGRAKISGRAVKVSDPRGAASDAEPNYTATVERLFAAVARLNPPHAAGEIRTFAELAGERLT